MLRVVLRRSKISYAHNISATLQRTLIPRNDDIDGFYEFFRRSFLWSTKWEGGCTVVSGKAATQ